MTININSELYSFFVTLVGVFICCMLYDVFSVFIREFRLKKIYCAVVDCIFWMVSALILWLSLFEAGGGAARIYQIAGGFLTAVLYFLTVSRLNRVILKKIYGLLKLFFKILLTPVRFLYTILYRAVSAVLTGAACKLKNKADIIKKNRTCKKGKVLKCKKEKKKPGQALPRQENA